MLEDTNSLDGAQMTIFNTVIPILTHFSYFSLETHNFAPKENGASNVKPDVSQWKATLLNDVGFPTLNRSLPVQQIFDIIQQDFKWYSQMH